jgi:hypothetical protein
MRNLHKRSRTLLGAVIAAAVLILPSTAFADCTDVVVKAAFKGSIAQWYPQQCYSAALSKLGPDANTYSPNVARNLRSAMRRDRTRIPKFTLAFLPRNKVRVTANVKLKSLIQLRKGAKILASGSISAQTTTLKLKKTAGNLTVALIWKLGTKSITLTRPATLAKVPKKR